MRTASHGGPAGTLFALLVCVLLSLGGVRVAVSAETAGALKEPVTADSLKAKIKEAGDSAELEEAIRNKLVERLRRALNFIETASANIATTEDYRKARDTAPAETQRLRNRLESVQKTAADVELKVREDSPLEAINQELISEKANLAAVSAKLTQLETELSSESDRPARARNRISEIKLRLEQLAAADKETLPEPEMPRLAEARSLSLEAEKYALDTEIQMLDQELLSHQARNELLQAQRDYNASSLERIQQRVSLLESLLSSRRVAEAEQAKTEAQAAERELEGKHPLLQELASQNTELGQKISRFAQVLDEVSAEDDMARQQARKVADDYRKTRQRLEIAGLSEELGEVMLRHRRLLPSQREFIREAEQLQDDISAASLRQIQFEEELRNIRNIDAYIDDLTAGLDAAEVDAIRDDLTVLVQNRTSLLEKAIQTDRDYLTALGELDFARDQFREGVRTYEAFLSERLLWVRSAGLLGVASLQGIPEDIVHLLAPSNWLGVLTDLMIPTWATPLLAVAVLIALLFVFRRQRAYRRLLVTGREVGRPVSDRFQYTLQALGYSVAIASVWPFLLVAVALQLALPPDATLFSRAVSQGLLWLAPTFFFLQVFRVVCLKGGLAEVHFRWSRHSLSKLQREFVRLMMVYLPAGFVVVTLVNFDAAALAGAVGRVAIIVAQLALAVFFYHVFEPKNGALKWYFTRRKNTVLYRMRHLWFVLSLSLPAILVVLSMFGFLYTAGTLTASLARTLWLVISLVIVHQLVVRWLLLAQRRLAYKAALERQEAERAKQSRDAVAGSERDTEHIEMPEIDLVSLSTESRKLLNMAMIIAGAVGLYLIWSSVLPALGILDQVTLWHHLGIADGEEKLLPVTLADLGMAVLILGIMVLATRQFPAFLEMVLLQRLRITAGARYTAKTLSRYIIIATGVIVVASMLGGSWSKIQWLVAALGVGIGFGLQEIVANFICGLIILFERPIRVGDRVKVGEVEGFVTRIQIRATTIQTLDRSELLVPNKEFITSHLLNMSLTDNINRIMVSVGVAYGSDVRQAMDLMHQAARENERVLEEPQPLVSFEQFGDNSLVLNLRCFLDSLEFRLATISELHTAINDKLNAAGIVIAFPQRDVHLDTLGPLDIRIQDDRPRTEGAS
jgi:potassium efflux system protein